MLCFACEDPDPKSPGLSGCCQGVVRVLSGDVRGLSELGVFSESCQGVVRVLSELWCCQRVVRGFVRRLSGGLSGGCQGVVVCV